MPFNAQAIAYITKRYNTNMLTIWERLIKNIEWIAYQGYDYYILSPQESQYIHKLSEYGFKVTYNEVTQQYAVTWNKCS